MCHGEPRMQATASKSQPSTLLLNCYMVPLEVHRSRSHQWRSTDRSRSFIIHNCPGFQVQCRDIWQDLINSCFIGFTTCSSCPVLHAKTIMSQVFRQHVASSFKPYMWPACQKANLFKTPSVDSSRTCDRIEIQPTWEYTAERDIDKRWWTMIKCQCDHSKSMLPSMLKNQLMFPHLQLVRAAVAMMKWPQDLPHFAGWLCVVRPYTRD